MIVSSVAQIVSNQGLAEIEAKDTVRNACKVMCEFDVGAVVVLDDGALVGVLSERDVIRKCTCADLHTEETKVSEPMTRNPETIDSNGSLADALEIMNRGGFHHVPVLNGGKTIGMISADDIPEEYRMLLERFKEMRRG